MSQSTPQGGSEEVDMGSSTGWQVLAGKQSRTEMINALLNMPPHREFNKSEFADFADVSRKSIHTHLPVLEQLGIVEEVPESSPQRYRFNTDSEIAELLIKLDGAANNAGPHAGE